MITLHTGVVKPEKNNKFDFHKIEPGGAMLALPEELPFNKLVNRVRVAVTNARKLTDLAGLSVHVYLQGSAEFPDVAAPFVMVYRPEVGGEF